MKRHKLHTVIACALTSFTFLAMAPNAIAQEETKVVEEKEAAKNLERIAVVGTRCALRSVTSSSVPVVMME